MLRPRRSHKQFADATRKFLGRTMRVAKRELFIFDDIRPDASDKFPRFPGFGGPHLLQHTPPLQDRSSLVIHPRTRNSLLMSWRFLRPLHRFATSLVSEFWHGIQLARGCNHLAGPPCVKKDLGRRHAFVSRTSTHARTKSLAIETAQLVAPTKPSDRITLQYLKRTRMQWSLSIDD